MKPFVFSIKKIKDEKSLIWIDWIDEMNNKQCTANTLLIKANVV